MTPAHSDSRFTVTHRRVLAISVPMTLANATTPLLGVVATAAIGRLGQAHLLGAVAMASIVFDCLFWLFVFLRFATTALTAQALGAGDVAEQRITLIRALLLAAVIGLALIALQVPLGHAVFRLMGASPEVTRAAELYFHVRIWSAPFVLANAVLLGWLIGLARANTALALQVLVNAVNLVGDRIAGAVHRAWRHRGGLRGRHRGGDRHDRRPHRRVSSGRHTPARNGGHPRS